MNSLRRLQMATQQVQHKTLSNRRKTHVVMMKERYKYNQDFILKNTQLSIEEYRMLFFECGCSLLEYIYTRKNKETDKWYNMLAKNSSVGFWEWFSVEYKIAENDFLTETNYEVTREVYCEYVQFLEKDPAMEIGIYEFVKKLGNVKI